MDQVTKTAFKKVALIVGLAMAVCVGVYFFMGQQAAFEFLGAYLIEFSLSIDNLFVFITVFTAFRVPVDYQHRALGDLGCSHSAFRIHFTGCQHCRKV